MTIVGSLPLRLAFWSAMIFAVVMATLPHPPEIPGATDKAQHMLAFSVITTLAVIAYPRTSLWRIGEHLSFLGAMIELVQSTPALHRDCDIHDWIADTAMILLVLLIAFALGRRNGVTPAS